MFYTADKELVVRNSQDTVAGCCRGKTLLELCTSAQIRIMNGRSIGDIDGKYTCYKYNGSSVVDYVITSESNMKNVLYMQVLDFEGDISDHCCLSWSVKCNYVQSKLDTNGQKPFACYFIWDMSCIFKYQNAFSNEATKAKIRNFMSSDKKLELNIEEDVEKITDIYIDAANSSLLKHKVKRSKKRKHKPWFNTNLQKLKREVISLGKVLQKRPNDPEVRSLFFRTLKRYTKQRKSDHRKFKEKMMS
jgi:hypothetical protein